MMLTIGNHVASFNGQLDGVEPLAYLDQHVNAITVVNDRLIIGGDFSESMPYLAAVDLTTTIQERDALTRLTLAPVPADNEVFITLEGQPPANMLVEVVDAQGRRIPLRLEYFGERMCMDVSGLATGVYVAHLQVQGRSISARFIKS
jgi:hypothetical protein